MMFVLRRMLILRDLAAPGILNTTHHNYEVPPRSAASNLSGQSDQTFYFASVQITNTEIQEIRALVNHLPLLPD